MRFYANILAVWLGFFCSVLSCNGQTPEPFARMEPLSAGAWKVIFSTQPGWTYFLEMSEDLVTWRFAPVLDEGDGTELEWGYATTGSRAYLRVTSIHAVGDDVDQDGLTNLDELEVHSTNPLVADTDADGMPDGWEVSYGFNPLSPADAELDSEPSGPDGLNNLNEYLLGSNPGNPDTDGDGSPDGEESQEGTDPTQDTSAPVKLCYLVDTVIWGMDYLPPDNPDPWDTNYPIWWDTNYFTVDLRGWAYREGGAGGPFYDNLRPLSSQSVDSIIPEFSVWNIPQGSSEDPLASSLAQFSHWDGEGSASTQTIQVWLRGPKSATPLTRHYLKTTRQEIHAPPYEGPVEETELVSFTIPPGENKSSGQTFTAALSNTLPRRDYSESASIALSLLPVEVAPDVLQVNADFDEAQINPNTGRPQPDCDNATLIAYKKLPWSSQVLGHAVFDELHEGWFGVSPATLEPLFYAGASVKISKIVQTDLETGTTESGHVRLWITAGSATTFHEWKVDPYDRNSPAFTPTELVGLVYGPTATIPTSGSGKRYWIEGTKAGRCTLEFTYTKGATNFKHRQTFEVGCQWSPTQWKEVVRQHVYIESAHSRGGPGVDMSGLDITLGFMPNRDRCRAVYQYYGSLFLDRPNEFHWVGLAKRAGASVYWGFSDSQYAIETWPTSAIPATVATATSFQAALLRGMRDIFDDIGWLFMAYHVGGVKSMRYLRQKGFIGADYLTAWNQMAQGYGQNQPGLVDEASVGIARQEQEFVLLPSFTAVSTITTWGVPLDWILSKFSVNPVPGGLSFSQFNPNGNITNFSDRWPWIENPFTGMLLKWKQQGVLGRPPLVQPYIEFIAEGLTLNLGFGYPIK